ncbi:MAG TPA: ABC transporter permease [Vicinamibacterales bacterium]
MRLAALLGRALPAAERDELLGDVHEMYVRDTARMGRPRAWLKAIAEILSLAVRSRTGGPYDYKLETPGQPGTPGLEPRPTNHMDALFRDIRYAFRTLGRAPGFTFVVILMLALGIGANTAIFSLLDQLLYRPLPVHDPGALVQLDGPGAFRGRSNGARVFSYPMYRDFRDRNEVFSGVIGRFPTAATLMIDGQSERVQAEVVTGNFFEVLGVQPAAGRVFSGADDQTPGAHPFVVLSHSFWQRRFGADRNVVGRNISVNNHPMTIVGVAAEGFHGVVPAGSFDLAVPVMMKAVMTPTWNDLDNRRSRWLGVMARLRDGTTIDEALAQMNVVYRQINEAELAEMEGGSESFRERFRSKTLVITSGARGLTGNDALATPLLTMMAMVGLVLLIACANIANLILARSASRRREVAVRLALGAGRGTLVRQQLVESAVLSTAGGLAGLVVAMLCGRGVMAMLPASEGANSIAIAPDARVLLFALGISIVTAILFGLGPALSAGRGAVVTALKDEGGAVMSGKGQMRVRKGLVVAQVALSMLLVAAGGLFARSLQNLRQFDPGFASDGLVTFTVEPSLNGYTQPRIQDLLSRIREGAGRVPGVRSASMAVVPIMANSQWRSTVAVDGYQAAEGEDMNPEINAVGPGFFQTLSIQMLMGRDFDERDRAGAPRVAIVNETFARYFYKGENAVGRRFGIGREPAGSIEIIGVVRDAKTTAVKDETQRVVYTPIMQEEQLDGAAFYVRTSSEAAMPGQAIRELVRGLDPALPIFDLQTMEARMRDALFPDRLLATLSTAFALLATLLAAVGLYGVMSYAVARRRKEIGVRMALGADAGQVQRMVLGEISVMAAIGIVIGLGAAVGLGSLVQSALFGMSPLDPVALAGAVTLLTAVILVAGWMPARRASRVEPLRALRME